jgi:hypothetical protein
MKERERQLRQVSRDKQIAKHRFEPPKALLHTTSIEELDGYVITNDNVGPCMNVSQEPVFQGLLFPTSREYAQLKIILEEHGHTIQTAKYEAEALCAYLCSRGVVDAVLTEDSDAIAFGAPKTIFRFYQKDAFLVNFDDVLQILGLSKSSFQDMCMLFGCDFCEKVYKIGPKGAFDLVKQHHSWPEAYGHYKFVWIGKTSQTAKEFHACWSEVKGCFESFAYEHSQDQAMS